MKLVVAIWVSLGVFASSWAYAAPTRITWHGHAAFQIVTPSGKVIWIDPWLKNPVNPAAQGGKDPIAGVSQADFIIISHGHFDHVGDAVEIAKKTKARLVAGFELGTNLANISGYPKDQMGFDTLMNIGGDSTLANGEITVSLTPAIHSSSLKKPDSEELVYGGNPTGIVLKIKDGPTIYHSGDTAYFTDMKLIGEQYRPDIALINIGGHFGMEPKMAVLAAAAVRPRYAIPHHYKTFPVLTQDAAPFMDGVKRKGIRGITVEPGKTLEFDGRKLKNE